MMSKRTVTVLLAAVLALAAFAVVASDGSEADGPGNWEAHGFKENHSGTVDFVFDNGSSAALDFTVTVYESGNSNAIAEKDYSAPANAQTAFDISFQMDSGTHTVRIVTTSEGEEYPVQVMDIHVEKSIWSGYTPYAVIVIVIIIIAIAALYYIRSKPKVTPDTTFTELEEQKKSRSAGKEEKAGPSTERRRYGGSKDGTAPAKEEKAASFTELSEKKSQKKKDKKPEKLKYVSSRRK